MGGVDAWRAAQVFGFLEQPWDVVVPNVPIIVKSDLKRLMEQWQAYSQRFMIKLKWMQLIREPRFVQVSRRMIKQDLPHFIQEDETILLYCLEFWNKPEMNYHWKMSLKPTDTTVAIWKTRVYFKKEEGQICLLKRVSVPIWNVVDEESMKKLTTRQPPTLQRLLFRYFVSKFPDGNIFKEKQKPTEEKQKSLADFEAEIRGFTSSITYSDSDSDSDSEYSDEQANEEKYHRRYINRKK